MVSERIRFSNWVCSHSLLSVGKYQKELRSVIINVWHVYLHKQYSIALNVLSSILLQECIYNTSSTNMVFSPGYTNKTKKSSSSFEYFLISSAIFSHIDISFSTTNIIYLYT